MNSTFHSDLAVLATLLPNAQASLKRLSELKNCSESPILAVLGKYNHGKSTLLNSLIGADIFKAADKRETKEVSTFEHDGIVWVDTPGLDADVHKKDDQLAIEAACEKADILCLVHNVKAGELDKSEMQIYKTLLRQDRTYYRKLVLVLTQIDQVSETQLSEVEEKIRAQLPDLNVFPLSAWRFLRGKKENKNGLIAASRISEFQSWIRHLKNDIGELRRKETQSLVRKVRVELQNNIEENYHQSRSFKNSLQVFEAYLQNDLSQVLQSNQQTAVDLHLAS